MMSIFIVVLIYVFQKTNPTFYHSFRADEIFANATRLVRVNTKSSFSRIFSHCETSLVWL